MTPPIVKRGADFISLLAKPIWFSKKWFSINFFSKWFIHLNFLPNKIERIVISEIGVDGKFVVFSKLLD